MPLLPALPETWIRELGDELDQPYMQQLEKFLASEQAAGRVVYPPRSEVFRALELTRFEQVRVVIVGQDPYHGAGQAHGLSFSVPPGQRIPPSLGNIHRELERDCGVVPPDHGCLESWADHGVLLLNATLTVRAGEAGSHRGRGWEQFTAAVITALAARREGLIFLAWGKDAQRVVSTVDRERHHVLIAPHPSPLSAHTGFIGCGHFSAVNRLLERAGRPPVDWSLPAASRAAP